jgi:ParB family chromosome partitioning protein
MTPEEEAQLRFEITRFGFLVPLIVRRHPGNYGDWAREIIDGEHRFDVGQGLGMTEFPCWVIDADDDEARQLTPILNELHGTPDNDKLGALLKDLMTRQPEQELRLTMPFSRERFDELIGERTVDWDNIGKPPQLGNAERWVERVYRMPAEAAEVLDEAVARAKTEADTENDWQGIEYIAAEFMAR